MSANPPILAVPASLAEPEDRIERYRRNQLIYAVYHAELGKEEIKTAVGPDSFANHLPPTPNRSLVLAGGSSIGSTGSRSRGMVARMKPRDRDANQRPESTAFSCAPTELETPPPVRHSTVPSLKEQIILTANPIPLQAKDLQVSAQSQAAGLVATGQGRKRRREEQVVSPGRHAREFLTADETSSTQRNRLVQYSSSASIVVEPKPQSSTRSTRALRPKRQPTLLSDKPTKRSRP
jgi:hypothetical protein